jgi:hypothetical protein
MELQTMDGHEELNGILTKAGVSKIVYALVMPETEATIDAVLDGEQHSQVGRDRFHHLFREAWTQKQDATHEEFFRRWQQWVQPVVRYSPTEFAYAYPTAGASEALRESIHAFAARARRSSECVRLHVFHGEYEGFAAYAAAAGIDVQVHRRDAWTESIAQIGQHDQFFVSQPSALDGCVWPDFQAFADRLYQVQPTAQIMLDLSYVGCVAKPFLVPAESPNIHAIFISLSKPAGMYYHRIGGMLSKSEYPGLFGNKWFKNIASLAIGTEFMTRYAVRELPSKYQAVQLQVIQEINASLSLRLQPADILLLGIGAPHSDPSPLEKFLFRGSPGAQKVRVCLTPRIAHAINPELTSSVTPRYYERLNNDPR